jgi:hypothetical protein
MYRNASLSDSGVLKSGPCGKTRTAVLVIVALVVSKLHSNNNLVVYSTLSSNFLAAWSLNNKLCNFSTLMSQVECHHPCSNVHGGGKFSL